MNKLWRRADIKLSGEEKDLLRKLKIFDSSKKLRPEKSFFKKFKDLFV